MLYPNNAKNIDGKQNFKFVVKENLKDFFGNKELYQLAVENKSVSDWITDIPFNLLLEAIVDAETNKEFDDFIVKIAETNNITETEKPKTKTTKKPKTEIEEKYEKIDFKF